MLAFPWGERACVRVRRVRSVLMLSRVPGVRGQAKQVVSTVCILVGMEFIIRKEKFFQG